MTDLILRDLDPALLERVQRLASARCSGLQQTLVALLDLGLAHEPEAARVGDEHDAQVLAAAIRALENVPDDPGFALIGRHLSIAAAARSNPDPSIASAGRRPGLRCAETTG